MVPMVLKTPMTRIYSPGGGIYNTPHTRPCLFQDMFSVSAVRSSASSLMDIAYAFLPFLSAVFATDRPFQRKYTTSGLKENIKFHEIRAALCIFPLI